MAATASLPLDKQLQTLAAGFDALQQEFHRLYNRCQTLESSLETAKAQYAGLTSQRPHKAEPLDLPDTSLDLDTPLPFKPSIFSNIADNTQRNKITSASRLSQQIRTLASAATNGVTIHTGPAADRPSACNSAMPSISESPLEQDFTVEGTPSRLGCPFAAMANRKLSSHAASVVSRYRSGSRSGADTPKSSVSRINGRDSSVARASFADPIKAETCAMESHGKPQTEDVEAEVQASSGVCPIRFLDQHSPEEVAAYFELHKHELPRNHEICIKRYQSNEESIRQLDAKYGNLVSMITGLGHKHTPLLPNKVENEEDTVDKTDHLSDEKIRKWASSVDTDAADVELAEAEAPDDEERQARFDRPLRDVRLGESPSRPWGIQVPFRVVRRESAMSVSSAPGPPRMRVPELPTIPDARPTAPRNDTKVTAKPVGTPVGKCPFGFDAAAKQEESAQESQEIPTPDYIAPTPVPDDVPKTRGEPGAAFVNPAPIHINTGSKGATGGAPQMVFTGPVFIGYSLEQAMSLLQTTQQFNGVGKREQE